MTARYAWDCFRDASGTPSFEAMLDRLARLWRDPSPSAAGTATAHTAGISGAAGDFHIGCIMIAAPVFFARDEWVDPPRDWAKEPVSE
jgi:hypothetical protein